MSDDVPDWAEQVPPEQLRDAQAVFVQVSASFGGAPRDEIEQALRDAASRRDLDTDGPWIDAAARQIHAIERSSDDHR
ncbi:hypothetical protein [Jiangella ureilytica]|nr:hypothetical protein [Jiangella ureilytica]